MNDPLIRSVELAAQAIERASSLLITAGAGMGVDSGLPDFRGNEGFWTAYPAFRRQRLSFVDLANPRWFQHDPEQAWGFYGHRLQLYRDTTPHPGFGILSRWVTSKPNGYFVFTSNVDGHFQEADFSSERIVECHGSIGVMQCTDPCSNRLWSAADLQVELQPEGCRAKQPLPVCTHCGSIARPNILMFGDWKWVDHRSRGQQQRFSGWLQETDRSGLVVVECGAGTAVPTVRYESEAAGGTLVRINPREPEGPAGSISVPCGALEALSRIDELLMGA